MQKSLLLKMPLDPEERRNAQELPVQDSEAGTKTQLELDGFQYTVYPNPSHDRVYVTAGSSTQVDLKIQLHDMDGRLLAEMTWRPGLQPVQVIEIGSLANGMYMLSVTGKDAAPQYTRVVKQ